MAMRGSQTGDELGAKDLPEDGNREKEAWAGVDPPCAVWRQAAHGDHAVDVGMVLEALAPGVEHHEPANGRAEPFRIRADLEQRLRGRPKQQVVDDALVGEGETREWRWHREDDVDVAHGQELRLPRGHPGVPRRRQTPGTMPVPATVVREGRLRTLLTAIAVAAERGGAALRDRAEHMPMLRAHPRAMGVDEPIAMSAHNVGHLEGWPRHRLWSRRVRRTVSAPERGIASSGLATACRCFCERWRYTAVCRISV